MSVRIACLWVLIGCGGDEPRKNGGDRNPDGDETPDEQAPDGETPDEEEPPFACYSDSGTCDAGSEFCLESWLGDLVLSGICAPKPDGCHDCDCILAQDIEQVWLDNVSGTANCSGVLLYCEQQNEAIRVICQQ